MRHLRTVTVIALAVGTLGLAGCSSSSSSPATTATTAAPSASSTTPSVAITPVQDPSPAGTLTAKPTVTVPPGTPPTGLESIDLIVGTGPAVTTSDTVSVQYVGVAWSTGKQFDASWDRGSQPISFPLNGVIPGWTAGMVGMKAGGRRELVIPPNLAYGAAPPPGSGIAANETLIFIIDLVSIG
jgi:peptidylprolyl isomerase